MNENKFGEVAQDPSHLPHLIKFLFDALPVRIEH